MKWKQDPFNDTWISCHENRISLCSHFYLVIIAGILFSLQEILCLQCITDCPHQVFRFSTGSSAMKLKSIVAVVGRSKYIRVEKYVLALIGSAIWPFQLEKLHSLRKIYSTRFQVIQKIWQMTWWSRNSSSFNFQLHFHPRNCELEMKAPFFYFLLYFPNQVCQLFSFIAHSKCLLFMEVLLLLYIPSLNKNIKKWAKFGCRLIFWFFSHIREYRLTFRMFLLISI